MLTTIVCPSGLLPSPKTPATPLSLVSSFHALLRQSKHWRYSIIGSENAKTLRQKETCRAYKMWWRHGILASRVPRYMSSGDDWAPASRYACGLLEIWEEFDSVQLVERVEKVRKSIWNATLPTDEWYPSVTWSTCAKLLTNTIILLWFLIL